MAKTLPEQVGNYKPGMPGIKARDLNAFAFAAQLFGRFTAVPPLGISVSGDNVTFFLRENPIEIFFASLEFEGPSSEASYINERYWFEAVECSNSSGDNKTPLVFAALPSAHQDYVYDTATNLAELFLGTHNLPVNLVVPIFSLHDDQSPTIKRYYFWSTSAPPMFWAKITGSSVITTNRWLYTFVQVTLNVAGVFTTLGGGITSNAYNTIEANNVVCDVLGSGDDCNEFPIGITEQPLGPGAVVQMSAIPNCEGTLEYLFTDSNNAGGVC